MMSLSKFLMSRKFLVHLILAAVLLFILLMVIMQGLKIYTRHGQSKPVPDFSELHPAEARQTARQHNLITKVVDSLYIDNAPPGVVVDQLPEPGSKVKENRTIFLTINSNHPEQVTLPQLTDISFRQARVLIENSGLNIGRISYRPSEYSDLVLEVQKDSVPLSSGQILPKGARVDLIVGRRQGDQETDLPNLTGLTVPEAKTTLNDAMLNTGVVIYDASVLSSEDSLNARVWKQQPNPKVMATMTPGSSVDLWVTVDQLKIEDATEFNF
jgi:eukaryotic-like serine/threonine-protein kinase